MEKPYTYIQAHIYIYIYIGVSLCIYIYMYIHIRVSPKVQATPSCLAAFVAPHLAMEEPCARRKVSKRKAGANTAAG